MSANPLARDYQKLNTEYQNLKSACDSLQKVAPKLSFDGSAQQDAAITMLQGKILAFNTEVSTIYLSIDTGDSYLSNFEQLSNLTAALSDQIDRVRGLFDKRKNKPAAASRVTPTTAPDVTPPTKKPTSATAAAQALLSTAKSRPLSIATPPPPPSTPLPTPPTKKKAAVEETPPPLPPLPDEALFTPPSVDVMPTPPSPPPMSPISSPVAAPRSSMLAAPESDDEGNEKIQETAETTPGFETEIDSLGQPTDGLRLLELMQRATKQERVYVFEKIKQIRNGIRELNSLQERTKSYLNLIDNILLPRFRSYGSRTNMQISETSKNIQESRKNLMLVLTTIQGVLKSIKPKKTEAMLQQYEAIFSAKTLSVETALRENQSLDKVYTEFTTKKCMTMTIVGENGEESITFQEALTKFHVEFFTIYDKTTEFSVDEKKSNFLSFLSE